ncbi:MAG: CBS domain-containing protein [Candidatus Hadarchaeota archaeon]
MGMKFTVEEFMTRRVVSIDDGESIFGAARVLSENRLGSVIVTHGGRPVGILTDRDILTRAVAQKLKLEKESVAKIMSKPLVTVKPESSMFDVMKLMEKHSIRRIPVVKDGEILGIVTQSDVERAALLMPKLSSGVKEIYLIKNGKKSMKQ